MPKSAAQGADRTDRHDDDHPDHDSRLPMPGGVIVKQFRGETLVVKVTDLGFEYSNHRYTSLSAIAQEITAPSGMGTFSSG